MRRVVTTLAVATLWCGAVAPALAQAAGGQDAMHAMGAKSLTWSDVSVPGFDAGMKIAVLHGNPEAEGSYTLRLSFPDGYTFPPHWHPNAENVTVLTGTLLLAMGEKVDKAALKAYGAGDYLHIPATKPHFGGAKGYTEIQLHGQGPFAINVVKQATY